jgi:choline dehydrogenase-like flavoprotein
MKSGIKHNVGTRFSFNAGLPIFALFPEPINAFEGVQMAAYIDTNDYLIESLFYPPMAFAAPLPGWFETHFERMRAYNRTASAGVLIGTEANGRVKRSGWQRKLFGPVDYRMTPNDLQKIKRGIAKTTELYFAAGAEQVFPATFIPCEMSAAAFAGRPEKIWAFIDERLRQPDDLTLGSAHPQGGNPMSDNPSMGVIDSQFRVHGTDNIYVCDASVFPTTIRINPQLTIMAMADYFSHLSGWN